MEVPLLEGHKAVCEGPQYLESKGQLAGVLGFPPSSLLPPKLSALRQSMLIPLLPKSEQRSLNHVECSITCSQLWRVRCELF